MQYGNAISHRIAVLHDGILSSAESATKLTAEKVGLLMGGSDALKGVAEDAAQDTVQGASA